jgi:hypothetical protein
MPPGQPTLYREEYAEQAFNYCLLGATDKDLARFFHVCEATINNWKKDNPRFLESINGAKEKADSEIVKSLFDRAKGYSHPEYKFATHEGLITDEKEYTRYYPPDTKAIEFWLKNRQPDKFRDKQELGIQANVKTTNMDLTSWSEEDLVVMEQLIEKNNKREDNEGSDKPTGA